MEIDVKNLTFRDATPKEKRRIFFRINRLSFAWLIPALIGIGTVFFVPVGNKLMTRIVMAIATVVLIYSAVSDLPAWKCKVCRGTVSNKREIRSDENTGLYYDAVTFTSEKNEVIEEMPVYSAKTLQTLEEGSSAYIVCYNKRQPVIFSAKQLKLSSES
ncbi:MAG: hypothetical protein J6Y08_03345 [Clostridiales bacterium]|nr:hypothetical protein [Clostridiales bacterium]